MAINRIAYLIAGAALGAAGMALVKEGKGENMLQSLVQGGHGLTEKLLGTVETLKEDVEDYLAEARYTHEQKMKQTAKEATKASKPAAAKTTAAKASTTRKTSSKTTAQKAATKKTAAKKTTKPATKKAASAKKPTTSKSTATTKKNAKPKTAAKTVTDTDATKAQ
jgi:hypothetical protein